MIGIQKCVLFKRIPQWRLMSGTNTPWEGKAKKEDSKGTSLIETGSVSIL